MRPQRRARARAMLIGALENELDAARMLASTAAGMLIGVRIDEHGRAAREERVALRVASARALLAGARACLR